MKRLHLMRHAKSSWDAPGMPDRDRPLNKRGRRDAPRMGEVLAQRLRPLAVFASPARRAQETLEGLCHGWPGLARLQHQTEEDLYTFSARDLLDWLSGLDDSMDSIFMIGHNPALTELACFLDEGGGLDNLPTAGYLDMPASIDHWDDLRQGCAQIEYRLFPRQLRA